MIDLDEPNLLRAQHLKINSLYLAAGGHAQTAAGVVLVFTEWR